MNTIYIWNILKLYNLFRSPLTRWLTFYKFDINDRWQNWLFKCYY